MASSRFASGEELFNAKSRNQVLPSWGVKESQVSGSWFEERQVEARLQDRHELISELRLAKKDQLAVGRWIDNSKMVLLIHQTGTFWEYMGVETDIGRCLYPEEALYLIEMGELEVMFGDMPLSMQSAQSVMLLDEYHLDLYYVYCHLAHSGCKVVRHQPHIRFTKYEKQIRLDQHQVKKNKKKHKLKVESSKETSQENVRDVQVLPEKLEKDEEVVELEKPNLDAALKDFYSVIGDDIPSLTETDNTEVLEITKTDCSSEKVSEGYEVVNLSEDMNDYERKRHEYLNRFPCMLGMTSQIIYAEDPDLLPENSKPVKEVYKISLEILNYYSRYLDDGNQNNNWKFEKRNNWNRGQWNASRQQRNNRSRFQGFNDAHGRSYNDGNWLRGGGNSANRESRLSGRGTGMYMTRDQIVRGENEDNISVDKFLSTVRNENFEAEYNSGVCNRSGDDASSTRMIIEMREKGPRERYRFSNDDDTLQSSRVLERGSLHYSRVPEGSPNRGDNIPLESRWAENGKYSGRQSKNTRDGNSEERRVNWPNDIRENIHSRSIIDQNIYGRERESIDNMRQAIRRESSSRWQDEYESEKRARMSSEVPRGRQEILERESWDRTNHRNDEWERPEKVSEEHWSRTGVNDVDRQESQSSLSENLRARAEQSYDVRWDRQERPHEKRWDGTSMDFDNRGERWARWPEGRQDLDCRRAGYSEPGAEWQRNEFRHAKIDVNESLREWRGDVRNPECIQGKVSDRQRDKCMQQDEIDEERRADERYQYWRKSQWGYDKRNDRNIYNAHQSERMDSCGRRSSEYQGSANRFQSHENRTYSSGTRKPDWHQHDDRWSDQNSQSDRVCSSGEGRSDYSEESFRIRGQDPHENWGSPHTLEILLIVLDSSYSNQTPYEPEVDLTVRPEWKNKRRRRNKGGYDTYPSYLVKLSVKVNSWKEYKDIVNSMSEGKILNQGLGKVLWRGPSVPLIKPSMASTLENILNNCCIKAEEDANPGEGHPMEGYLVLHYDVYLPNMVYRKSSPSIPGKRITVIRNGAVPSLKQIQEVTKRFPDEAPVVCAVVTVGEVRLYTLSPITIPSS
ncbi:LOW QUALITY PROTEIN: uncharacterized protein LOC135205455 [Macrobrachium nipponense]|uniref:LOW QUALITY PROTEIN: uncharacterized protein LOC135205455 n=1 Tax=Macrobrachium nipponense TaxID=159736 RepID=UPI0030C7BEFD